MTTEVIETVDAMTAARRCWQAISETQDVEIRLVLWKRAKRYARLARELGELGEASEAGETNAPLASRVRTGEIGRELGW